MCAMLLDRLGGDSEFGCCFLVVVALGHPPRGRHERPPSASRYHPGNARRTMNFGRDLLPPVALPSDTSALPSFGSPGLDKLPRCLRHTPVQSGQQLFHRKKAQSRSYDRRAEQTPHPKHDAVAMGCLPHIRNKLLGWTMRRFWVPPVCDLRVEWGTEFHDDHGRNVGVPGGFSLETITPACYNLSLGNRIG
jgi:hypothetical protein